MDSTRPSLLFRIKDRADIAAWQEFFDLYSPLLYRYAVERGLAHDDAEDIRASCYETIVRKIAEFEYQQGNTGFRAWLRTMVNHRVIDFMRKRKMPIAESSDLRSLPDQHETIDEIWDENWRLHHLRFCVAQVGKRVQPSSLEVFRLLTEQGLSVEEVCTQMDMNHDQVYKIKSRFIELVRTEMKRFNLE